MSHYICAYTRTNGRKQETACQTWAEAREHSAEPTCPLCAAWLQQDAEEAEQVAASFGLEIVNGFLVPKEQR